MDKQAKTRAEARAADESQARQRPALGNGEHVLINKQGKHAINYRNIREFFAAVAPELGVQTRAFSVVLINDERMRRYNLRYRGFDMPTDVLSFSGDPTYLGDILISSETAYNQARKSRTLTFDKNIRRLILHGLLHLMGYDHETDFGEMRRIERRLRRRFQC